MTTATRSRLSEIADELRHIAAVKSGREIDPLAGVLDPRRDYLIYQKLSEDVEFIAMGGEYKVCEDGRIRKDFHE